MQVFSIVKINRVKDVREFYITIRILIDCLSRAHKYCFVDRLLIEDNWYLLSKKKILKKVSGDGNMLICNKCKLTTKMFTVQILL